jgi:hypothetical protein
MVSGETKSLALRHQLGVLAPFGPTLPLLRPSTLGALATVVAAVERGSGSGPAGHSRPLASRRISSMLEPSPATATRKATHRFTAASPHSTNGHRDRSELFLNTVISCHFSMLC